MYSHITEGHGQLPQGNDPDVETDHRFVEEADVTRFMRGKIEVARLYGTADQQVLRLTTLYGKDVVAVLHRVESVVWRPVALLEILRGASIQGLLGSRVTAPVADVVPVYHPAPGLRNAVLAEILDAPEKMVVQQIAMLIRRHLDTVS